MTLVAPFKKRKRERKKVYLKRMSKTLDGKIGEKIKKPI